ncbi:PIG-L deacetylase family protein [Halpernia frigidisoli]|uniref:N-acetylglucosaminyl deacetylase, LmbE family n=1 Tax=Halpernia frigidisoli TaxID=1125876 RepID=A0A1I3D106_9FLAO|nr:PIG-L family deacetylase [Halpernia frigidisoli]SFH80454.1 N-acetylglucosaminyl deacetylase, LmbE family [Halpernia frigidisoli]
METENIPLAPEQCVTGFGTTLIVAPHADDESLGCGGVISLLGKYHQEVYILLLSDGTLSHPNSKEYPAEKLRDLRENELVSAANHLNVNTDHIIFCRHKDRNVPNKLHPNFDEEVQKISKFLLQLKPKSIFVPWRRDPHPDHRAAFELITAANNINATIYEYPIWLKELGENDDSPKSEEVMPFRINISSVLSQKQSAIACHQSQISDLISDDEAGFRLSKEMLEQFNVPYETFFISK